MPTKQGTIQLRNSKAIPGRVTQRSGTVSQLRKLLRDRELGWCPSSQTLYIKDGKTLRPIASGGGSASIVVEGTTDEVVVQRVEIGGVTVFKVALAKAALDSQVPSPPSYGASGKVLTANEDGTFSWQNPPVKEVGVVEL